MNETDENVSKRISKLEEENAALKSLWIQTVQELHKYKIALRESCREYLRVYVEGLDEGCIKDFNPANLEAALNFLVSSFLENESEVKK